MRKLLFVSLLLVQVIMAAAQQKHLVPYRFKNTWGFSDTLGKVIIQPKFDSTDFFIHNDFADTEAGLFFSKGKRGLISFKRKIIIPAQYDEITPKNDYYEVRQGSKYGLYTASGRLVLPVRYDQIEPAEYSGSTTIFRITTSEKHGLYEATTNKLIPVGYDLISNEFWSQKTDRSKWFYAENEKGKFLINRLSFKIIPYTGDEDLSDVGSVVAVPPSEAAEYDPVYDDADIRFIKEKFEVEEARRYKNPHNPEVHNYKIYSVKKGGKSGLVFEKTFLPPVYDSVHFVLNLFTGSNYLPHKSQYLIAVQKEKFYGLVNEHNQIILPFTYDFITSLPGYGFAFLTVVNGKQGMFTPFTPYAPIEAKYDAVSYKTYLPVTGNWNFAVFKTVTNGKPGYVGENGVAYFKNQ